MADKAQGAVSFTPIVTIAADSDADAVDAIHHNIKQALGGDLTYEFVVDNEDDKWFYAPNVIVNGAADDELFGDTDNASELIGATGDQVNGPNEAAGQPVDYTDGTQMDCDADKVYFLFIKNTGTSDTDGTATTESVYFTIDDNDSTAHNTNDAIEVAAGEAWMSRLNGVVADDIHIIAGTAKGAGASSSTVRCTVVAVLNDAA